LFYFCPSCLACSAFSLLSLSAFLFLTPFVFGRGAGCLDVVGFTLGLPVLRSGLIFLLTVAPSGGWLEVVFWLNHAWNGSALN